MKKSRKVAVNQLQVGNFIRLPVSWKDHPFLFSSFRLKQQTQIELIKKLAIEFVFVDLERSDSPPLTEEVAKTKVVLPQKEDLDALTIAMKKNKSERIEKLKRMRRDLQKTEQDFDRSIAKMRNLVSKLRNRPLNAINDAKELINDMSEKLLSSDNLVLHLMGEAKDDESIYYHSLNVTVLSMLMAKELGWDKADIELVGMGSLFHDTGKLNIPPQLLRKKTPLTPPEVNFMKQHPIMGTDLLKRAENFPSAAMPIVLNHHEYLDGSGYPRGLKENKLDKLCQLVAVVNLYDSLCHPDARKKARTPYAALGHIYKNFKAQLNQQVTGKMIKMLGIYPPGSIVELSSGQFAMVMSVNLDKILFPRILVYDAMVPKEQAPIVDLEVEGLSIVRCIQPMALPEKIFKYLNPRERVSYYIGSNS
ncbi:HD family phosphohydrolase [Shewanella benthica]|uniref:HD family phosphohydrolase n=1 Tax=Shewanella benthica TaxID=43661 RepID=A0A330M8V7_9GAMM|nr:HD-GYP domain-containing protein [Shewanella benthica]SQH76237.1 HD family phosphohydrolase [Shewanella benthica]